VIPFGKKEKRQDLLKSKMSGVESISLCEMPYPPFVKDRFRLISGPPEIH
jgi:hypothetical protein